MGILKSAAKRTRQQRLVNETRILLDQLFRSRAEVRKYEKALTQYANKSNWCLASGLGRVMEWTGPGNGPSLAQDVLKVTIENPDSGKMEAKPDEP